MSPLDNQLKVWMSKYGWSADESGQIFICSQEESIKPKNIVEKIDFDSEWPGAVDWELLYPHQSRLGCAEHCVEPSFLSCICIQGEPVRGAGRPSLVSSSF